jgi:hypothetical protein
VTNDTGYRRARRFLSQKYPFELFYKKFKGQRVEEITKTEEWKEVYSHYYSFDKYELDIIIGEED